MRAIVSRPARILLLVLGLLSILAGGYSLAPAASPIDAGAASGQRAPAFHDNHHPAAGGGIKRSDRVRAQLAAAAFQDVKSVEAAGWKSSLQTLGCFQDPTRGGMGVHYINDALLDDEVDVSQPEALVYELDADGAVAGLVAHEYIVPVEAWDKKTPPRLFGVAFHQRPTLPLFVLHAWLWKHNARGVFDDWNPAVRQCPSGVPVFGTDLPARSR